MPARLIADHRLQAILASLAAAVTVQDAAGRLVYANAAAAGMIGATVEELLSAEPGEIAARFELFHRDGRPVELAELPGRRVLAGERPDPLVVRNVRDGVERWYRLRATPLVEEPDGPILAVNAFEDVGDAVRAARAQRLLARAGELLSSSLDYGRTLQQVAALAVPDFSDWCGVDLPGENGTIELVAVAHPDPDKIAIGHELRREYPVPMDAAEGLSAVIRGATSSLVQEIPDAMLVEAAVDDRHLELLRSIGFHSVLVVPMKAGHETIGAVTFVHAESGRLFTDDDVEVAEELGRRAGAAVGNARLYRERGEIAHTLQAGLLPRALPAVPGWDIAALYRPAGEANEVGGDFYDVFEIADGWIVTIGDIEGKGARAAALTSVARQTLRTVARITGDPARALCELNQELRREPELALCTALCVKLVERDGAWRACVANGGHPAPLLLRDGEASPLGEPGPLLGAFDEEDFGEASVSLRDGDRIVLYTDGVTDTVGAQERFGERRLVDTLRAEHGSATEAIQALEAGLQRFERGEQKDDTAVLLLRRR